MRRDDHPALRALAGVGLAALLAMSPQAAAGTSSQVLIGPNLSFALGGNPEGLARRFGIGVDVAWQAIPSRTGGQLPSHGAGGRIAWTRFHHLSVAGFFRGGLVGLQQTDGWYTHGHFPRWSVEGDLGLGFTTHGDVGVYAGVGGTASVAALRASTLVPFVGPARHFDPQLHAGLSLPAITSTGMAIPGRPVRVAGRPTVAPLLLWGAQAAGAGAAGDETAAWRWLRAGQAEAASVPAFQRLAGWLRSLGAPGPLVAGAERAAGDEAVHAVLCHGMAARHGLRSLPSAPARPSLPTGPRRAQLALLARESWLDGVLNEGRAAQEAAQAADRADDALEAAVQRRIASDEARHARLAADVLAWCHSQAPGCLPAGATLL